MTMSNKKTINLISDVLAPLAIIVVTIALFFTFQPEEPGTLFWTNLVYSVILEIILLAYIVWLPAHGDSVALKWMFGVYSVIYVCIALAWMLLFSIVLCHWVSIKVYYAVIAILTVLWILISAQSLKVDKSNETSTAILTENRKNLDHVSNNAEMMLQQFNLMLSLHPELREASSSVSSLCRGLMTLSPSAMGDTVAAGRVNNICSGLENLLNEQFSDTYPSKLKEYAEKSTITLNNIKKSIRK